jgi:hypothetical protein
VEFNTKIGQKLMPRSFMQWQYDTIISSTKQEFVSVGHLQLFLITLGTLQLLLRMHLW